MGKIRALLEREDWRRTPQRVIPGATLAGTIVQISCRFCDSSFVIRPAKLLIWGVMSTLPSLLPSFHAAAAQLLYD